MSSKNDVRSVTRFEVIDPTGRRIVMWANVEAHFQDDGQTLKVFVPEKVKLLRQDPPDPKMEQQLARGIAHALPGRWISERQSLANVGLEPEVIEGEEDHDFDWTPDKD